MRGGFVHMELVIVLRMCSQGAHHYASGCTLDCGQHRNSLFQGFMGLCLRLCSTSTQWVLSPRRDRCKSIGFLKPLALRCWLEPGLLRNINYHTH